MILTTLFRFAFASASGLYPLTSHHIVTRRPVLQKVRDHTLNRALSACKLTVSGSFSLPSRGSFHLSLTVLVAIGHVVVFSLLGWSPFLPSGFLVSRRTPDSASLNQYFGYRVVTFFDVPFQVLLLYIMILLLRSLPQVHYKLGLGFSDFARHYSRNHFCFLFLRVLRCFSSPGSPYTPIYSAYNNTVLPVLSSLIRISADL